MNSNADRRNRGNKLMKLDYLPQPPEKSAIKEKNLMHASNKKIFIGPDYQAELPSLLTAPSQLTYESFAASHETLLWTPTGRISDEKLTALVAELKPKGFDEDQLLPFLRYQNYDVDATLSALNNDFVGKQEGMPLHDKVLFVQGYGFHGKNFERIRDLVPNHSIQTLISHYYTEFKRSKSNRPTILRPESDVKKLSNVPGVSEMPKGERPVGPDGKRPIGRPRLSHPTKSVVPDPPEDGNSGVEVMDVDGEDGKEKAPSTVGWVESEKQLEAQIVEERKQIAHLTKDEIPVIAEFKKVLEPLDVDSDEGEDVKKARKASQKDLSPIWLQEEIVIFLRSLVEFGTDFGKSARLLPRKTEQQVRNFYYNRNHFYGLDKLVSFHEGKIGFHEEKMAKEKSRVN